MRTKFFSIIYHPTSVFFLLVTARKPPQKNHLFLLPLIPLFPFAFKTHFNEVFTLIILVKVSIAVQIAKFNGIHFSTHLIQSVSKI